MRLFYGMEFDEYQKTYSETFEKYFNHLLKDEGGYLPGKQARKIKDPGGATNFGISLKFLLSIGIQKKDLEADGDINNDGVIDEKDIVCLTKQQAKDLYFKYFFNPLYDLIKSQNLANRIFNFGVNAGKKRAVMLIQQTINELLDARILRIDGLFGKDTLNSVNVMDPDKLYDRYIINIEDFYRGLKKPGLIAGWMNRLRKWLSK